MSELKKLLKESQEDCPIAKHKFRLQFEEFSTENLKIFLETSLEHLNKGTLPYKQFQMKCFEFAFMNERRKIGCFHPSELSQYPEPCERKLKYQFLGLPEDESYISFAKDLNMRRLLDLGTMIHLYLQLNLKKLGILIEHEVDVKGDGIGGNADGKVTYNNEVMVLEIKSMNPYVFQKLIKPDSKHVKQASIYADKLGLAKILFIYYNKATSEIKTFVVEKDVSYLDKLYGKLKGVLQKLKIAKMRRVDFDKACNNRICERAVECPYVNRCFNE